MDPARVRSYHARNGRLSATKRDALAELLPGRAPQRVAVPVPAAELCGRPAAPTVIEIGAGTGEAALALARARPDWNVLVAEVHRASLATLLLHLAEQGSTNVTVADFDGYELLADRVADASVAELWAYFPDPWPKARQRQRRLVQAPFIAQAARVLVDGGWLRLATDDAVYAEQMRAVVSDRGELRLPDATTDGFSPRHDRPTTFYEARALAVGRVVRELHARREPRVGRAAWPSHEPN